MGTTLTTALNPALVQRVLLYLLIIFAPFAMSFTPHGNICTDLPIRAEPLYRIRASLILGGLLGSVLSVTLLLWHLSKKSNEILETTVVSNVALQMSITICSVVIGWVAFPYWVNGVFQGYRGNLPADCYLGAFDPKDLMPMIWIGEIWRLGVVLIFLASIFVGAALLLVSLPLTIKGKNWKEGIATVACLAITAAIFFLSPGYGTWLGD
jgi:hypothetical protein